MKLYVVEVTYKAYVMAEDEYEAADSSNIHEIVNDAIGPDETYCYEATGPSHIPGWNRESLVYGADRDTSLEEALELCKVR